MDSVNKSNEPHNSEVSPGEVMLPKPDGSRPHSIEFPRNIVHGLGASIRGSELGNAIGKVQANPLLADAALVYARRGWPVFPLHTVHRRLCSCGDRSCRTPGKHPRYHPTDLPHGLRNATVDEAQLKTWWNRWRESNIGIATGESSGIFALDVDPRHGGNESLEMLVDQFGPLPNTLEQTTGGGGRHICFRHPGIRVRNRSGEDAIAPGLEIKGDGGYIVGAPSLHASGRNYSWEGLAGTLDDLLAQDICSPPDWLLEIIAAAKSKAVSKARRVDGPIPEGRRNTTLTSLAGSMRRRGMSEEAIAAGLLAENKLRCSVPLSEQEVKRIASSVGQYSPMTSSSVIRDWPEPLPIDSDLPPVDAFCEELLPVSFRALVCDVADRMQVPLDFPAIVTVLCLAGCVNRRAMIQPKANDSSWAVVPNLWGGIIAAPGFMKSPVIQAVTRPLLDIQADWLQQYQLALEEFSCATEASELRKSAWKEQFKSCTKRGKEAPPKPEEKPAKPNLRRLIVNDATFEALHQTMSENPSGIFAIRDELTGWWSTLDRPGREGERAFCLQAWNGDTGHTVDRIGRGTIHVDACCLSMLGGIQPSRLRSYLTDALKDGPSNDGLIQRFQLLVWPDTALDWNYTDREPDADSLERAGLVFRALVELSSEKPIRFRFSVDAQELFIDFLKELELKIRGDELHPALISHLSKYRKLMPALALLFELAGRAIDGSLDFETSPQEAVVSLHHTKLAAAWCDYLESHARRIYSCVTTPQMRAARELADKIKKRKLGITGSFSCREVYTKGWSGLDTAEAVRLAVDVLQDAGWLRELDSEPGPLGGRPSNRYAVNPRVWK